MNIELKNIVVFDKMSEETTAFHGTIRIDGKPVGEAGNDGKGGATYYRASHHDFIPLIKEAEKYCIQLPPVKYAEGDTLPMDLEFYLDLIVEKHIEQKEIIRLQKKRLTMQKDSLIFGTETKFSGVFWRGNPGKIPIETMLKHYRDILISKIAEVKSNLKPGERILNTNIPTELL
mgnify:CR=1 FL=1